MSLSDLHEKAFGLCRSDHEAIARMARNNYTEAYIASNFSVSEMDVREICKSDGYIPARNRICQNGRIISYKAREIL